MDDDSAALEMEEHRHLSRVLLSRLAPVKVRLPPGCMLTLHGLLEMSARVWRNSMAQSPLESHLRILHVTTSKPFHQSPNDDADHPQPADVLFSLAEKLQRIFSAACPSLTRVYLACSSFGSADSPIVIGAQLPCLTTLRVAVAQGSGIHLAVTASPANLPCLTSLRLLATDQSGI